MNEQYLNDLAEGLLSLIEHEDPSERNIGMRGTALINEFIRKPGVEESLGQLDVEKKVRLWGSKGSGMQILFHGADTPKRGSPHDHTVLGSLLSSDRGDRDDNLQENRW